MVMVDDVVIVVVVFVVVVVETSGLTVVGWNEGLSSGVLEAAENIVLKTGL